MNQFHRLLRMESREQDDLRTSRDGEILASTQPITMEKRHRAQEDLLPLLKIRTPEAPLHRIDHHVTMREHDTLGGAGRAAGILNLGQRVRLHRG